MTVAWIRGAEKCDVSSVVSPSSVRQLLSGQQEGSECRGTNTADEFVFLKSRLHSNSKVSRLVGG